MRSKFDVSSLQNAIESNKLNILKTRINSTPDLINKSIFSIE